MNAAAPSVAVNLIAHRFLLPFAKDIASEMKGRE